MQKAPFVKKYNNTYTPGQTAPFRLSRSKIDMFTECALCFYLDRVKGVSKPSMPGFTLNIAVDHLLKKEFDFHRARSQPHPLMSAYGVDAVPFSHPDLDVWRENFKGVQYLHPATNFLVTGAVDDVWVNSKDELMVVDYKATSKDGEVELTDTKWHQQYKRQMEIYQWLLRQNEFKVSNTGYFVYVNGKKDREAFDARLEFDVKVIPYTGSDEWIENVLAKIKACLEGELPEAGPECEHCAYRAAAMQVTNVPSVIQKAEKKVRAKKRASEKAGETLF